MILLIDNYDSFTFNLYHLCASVINLETTPLQVVRNDKITLNEIKDLNPKALILSPGPKSPAEAGICIDLIRKFSPHIPILGVCLGMQAIGAAFGAEVIRAPFPMHGKIATITHTGHHLYENAPQPMKVGRYHSLMVERSSLPSTLIADSFTEDGLIMGLRHRDYPCFGVQFHPESILTQGGDVLIKNFFKIRGFCKTPFESKFAL